MKAQHEIITFSAAILMFLLMITSADAYDFPPYRGITLKVIGDIAGNYNTNVTYASDKENKISDFRTMLNLGLDFQYDGKRRSVGFSGLVKRQINQTSSNIQNPSENVTLNYIEYLTKYDSIRLRDNFVHTLEPGNVVGNFDMQECRDYYGKYGYSTTEIESMCNEFNEEFGRFQGRFDSYSNTFNFNYYKNLNEAFTLIASYDYAQNRSDVEGTNDSDRNRFGLSGNYKYSEATNFSLSYSYQISDFDRGEDISNRAINVGIGQYITKNSYLDAQIGKVNVSSGRDTISAVVTFRGEIDEKTLARLSYSQGVEINANTDDSFENWQTTGYLSRVLLEDLSGSLSAFYGKGDYSSTSVNDTLLGASVKLSYDFWQNKRGSSMKVSLGYAYSNLDSSDEDRGYTRNSINTSLTAAF